MLAMVSRHLVPLFRGWFLSGRACASLCLSLFLFGCFVPLYAGCGWSLRPPCSLSSLWFSVVSSPPFVRASCSFLSSSSLGSVSCVFFASGSSLGALVLGLSLRASQAGPLSALAGVLSLGWGTSGSLVAGVFFGVYTVPLSLSGFRTKPQPSVRPLPRSFLLRPLQDFVGSLLAELLLCPFRALRLCFSHAAAFPSCPRSLFVSPRSPSLSLSLHSFSFFLCDVMAGALSSASRSLPSAPCSSYSTVPSFSSSRPRASLSACGVRGFAAS